MLQDNGFIKLKDGKDITATIKDVEEANGITFKEVEAAQIPNTLKDVDFGIINSNYAIDAKLNPIKDSLIMSRTRSFAPERPVSASALREMGETKLPMIASVAAVATNAIFNYLLLN